MRLNKSLNVAVNAQVNDIALSTGDFVSTLVTARVNYSLNTTI